jgi:hypothetical protein
VSLDLTTVRLTRQKMNQGIWVCAAITMTASAISGVTSFYTLQNDGWGIASGAMTALAVDVALWVVLTGDHLLERLGLVSGPWGRALRWGTAGMSVVLNCLAAIVLPIPAVVKVPLVLIHAFVPLIMVGLAEYRGECARVLTPAERDALAQEEAATQAKNTAPLERSPVSATDVARLAADQPKQNFPKIQQAPELHVSTGQPSVTAHRSPPRVSPSRPVLHSVSRSQNFPAARPTPVRDAAFAWLDRHPNPSDITAAKLAAAIGGSPNTCKKLLGEWRKQKAAS